ncbi:MAG TPA: rhodanese-like domain-containing protein [Thermomicrobiales bacterium]|nr:rhodanese-like domain-containing protein [Thermomicrobiales bacterium]
MTSSSSPVSPISPVSPLVTVDWLAAHLSDSSPLLVIDVRPQPSYLAGHIPGAISLDVAALRLPTSDDQTIEAWTAFLQKGLRGAGIRGDQQVVFYEDVTGTLSSFGVWLLDVAGLHNGALLDGGIRAWHAAGQPLSTERVTATPSDVTLDLDRSALATATEIISDLGGDTHSFQMVDTRGIAENSAGTIPTSVNVEWVNTLGPTGALKSAEELKTLYASAGLDPDQPAVTYCAGGFRAAHTYVVLKSLGFQDVRSYAPSWSEWSQLPETPIEYPSGS